MAARTRALKLNDRWREKIQITQILNRLNACLRGEIEMTPVQIQAAKILLSKVAPDLTAISGEITHRHHSEMVREIIIQPVITSSSSAPALIEGEPEYVGLEPIRELLNQDEYAEESVFASGK
jgi:hypothetical protein